MLSSSCGSFLQNGIVGFATGATGDRLLAEDIREALLSSGSGRAISMMVMLTRDTGLFVKFWERCGAKVPNLGVYLGVIGTVND